MNKIALPSDQNSSGRTLGKTEIEFLSKAIESGTLTSTKGQFVKAFEAKFAELVGAKSAYCASHGTAALHCAYAAVDPEPGDEFITTSITDMGALTPILYQSAVPVFADVDPATCNVTAETIEKVISPRTKAIIVTHLFGNPCEMGPIMELAKSKNIPVIEDCAQAFLAKQNGKMIGTIGDIGCFSLQQGKHITTGEGGVVVSNDEHLARRMFLFINKAWGYGDEKPDHYFLAPNYRMNELSGAVALAQLEQLDGSVATRIKTANDLTEKIKDIPGLQTPQIAEDSVHTYWKYSLNVDSSVVKGGAVGWRRYFVKSLRFSQLLVTSKNLRFSVRLFVTKLRLEKVSFRFRKHARKRLTMLLNTTLARLPVWSMFWFCHGMKATHKSTLTT